jgi:hypothetical protein
MDQQRGVLSDSCLALLGYHIFTPLNIRASTNDITVIPNADNPLPR